MSPKEQDGTQSRRTETGGSPHPANNRPDEFLTPPNPTRALPTDDCASCKSCCPYGPLC